MAYDDEIPVGDEQEAGCKNVEHTRGPWTTDLISSCEEVYLEAIRVMGDIDSSYGGLVADVYGYNEQNRQANARFIAAAPDLLAALKEAHGVVLEAVNDERVADEVLPDLPHGAGELAAVGQDVVEGGDEEVDLAFADD